MQMSGQSGCAWVHLAGLSWLSCGSATLIPERLAFLAIAMSLTLNKCLKKPNSTGEESLTFPMSRQSSEEEAEARPVWDGLLLKWVLGWANASAPNQEPFVFRTRVWVLVVQEWSDIWIREYKQCVKAQRSMIRSKACLYIIQTWAYFATTTLYYSDPSPGHEIQKLCVTKHTGWQTDACHPQCFHAFQSHI